MSTFNTIPQFHRFIHKKKLIPDSFNEELLEATKLIAFVPKNITFAGSFIRKSLSYSADIDISEQFSRTATNSHIAHALQSIVEKILLSPNYILDIKSGYDPTFERLFKNLGDLSDGTVKLYDRSLTQLDIKTCQSHKYIDAETCAQLTKLNRSDSVSSWLELREAVRKLITLRWTPEEVLMGYKQGLTEQITLETAVGLFVTKIDMAFIYEGFYTEMSNIFITNQTSRHGLVFYPVSSQPKYYVDAIKYNLFEYMHSKDKYWLKALKRVFTLALLFDDTSMQKKIAPILVSDVSMLNKVVSVMKTCLDLLEALPHPPLQQIQTQMDNVKPILANIYQFTFNEKNVDADIDKLTVSKKASMIKQLTSLIDQLEGVINTQAHAYIKEHKILIGKRYLK